MTSLENMTICHLILYDYLEVNSIDVNNINHHSSAIEPTKILHPLVRYIILPKQKQSSHLDLTR